MTAHKKPRLKGATLRPQNKSILVHLQANGRQTFEQLHALFKEPSANRHNHDNAHVPDPQWLRTRLDMLRAGAHVTKALEDGTWYFAAAYTPGTTQTARKLLQLDGKPLDVLVPPRRMYLMSGATYVPPRPTAIRPGAMDFTACPSVTLGKVGPYKPPREAKHG